MSSSMRDLLRNTTGKTFGAGGDYFTPGKHDVRVDDVQFFSSAEDGTPTFLVKSTIIDSVGGKHNWEMKDGVAKLASSPTEARPMPRGAQASWIQKSGGKAQNVFLTRVGNFYTACKQTLWNEVKHLPDAQIHAAIDSNTAWSAESKQKAKEFYRSCRQSPDVTQGDDNLTMLDLCMCKGLFLRVDCSDKGTKDASKVITNSVWQPLSAAKLAHVAASAERLEAGESTPVSAAAPADDDE